MTWSRYRYHRRPVGHPIPVSSPVLNSRDLLPDARDGLNRLQRIVLWEIHKAQRERGREFVPTAMLYGRVVEHVDISESELQLVLRSLGVLGDPRAGVTIPAVPRDPGNEPEPGG